MLETPDRFVFVNSVEDIERAHEQGKYAVVINSQTTSILDGDIGKIATLAAMGLSSMQLVYNDTYRAGDGVISYYWGKDREPITAVHSHRHKLYFVRHDPALYEAFQDRPDSCR